MNASFATLAAVALTTFTLATGSSATIIRIEPDGSGDAPTIQAGIDVANPDDIIELADGTFVGPGNRDIDYLGKAITVRSASGNAEFCIISGEDLGRGFHIHSGEGNDSVLENVTVAGGNGETAGGIYVRQASPTIRGCSIYDNSSFGAFGSGVSFAQSTAILEDCFIAMNSGMCTAGVSLAPQIYCFEQADVTLRNCVITAGWSWPTPDGPAVEVTSASPSFISCTIVGNMSYAIGALGGSTSITLQNTIIAYNTGEAVRCSEGATATASCCDLFHNWGGDWVGCLAGQGDLRGNFWAPPLFCVGDFRLQSVSPCAPPGITGCGLVGALPVGCGPVALKRATWGVIKGMYR